MPSPLTRPSARALFLSLGVLAGPLAAQIPSPTPGQPLPTPAQAEELLRSRPDLVQQLRERFCLIF